MDILISIIVVVRICIIILFFFLSEKKLSSFFLRGKGCLWATTKNKMTAWVSPDTKCWVSRCKQLKSYYSSFILRPMWRQGLSILDIRALDRRVEILRCNLNIRLQAWCLLFLCHKLYSFLDNAQSLYGPDYVAINRFYIGWGVCVTIAANFVIVAEILIKSMSL